MMYGLDRADHNRIDRRITSLSVVILFIFAAVIARLFWLQIVTHEKYKDLASRQQLINTTLQASRGQIFARDHTNIKDQGLYPLAANKIFYEVYIDPTKITRPQNTADGLAAALDLKAEDIVVRLQKNNDIYEPIKHKVTDQQLAVVKKLALPGVYFKEEVWRFYPDKDIGAQLLGFYGYQDNEKKGKYGLEGYWDKELSGVSSETVLERTFWSNLTANEDTKNAVEDGADLILTIDRTIEYEACRALDRAVAQYQAENGSAIVMESATGRILALCNSPSFDPNNYSQVTSISDFNNNAVFEAYEPGSAFKVIAMATAIDDGKVTPVTTYEDTGVVKLANYEIRNSDKKAHGTQTMTQVLERSLNTGMIFATDKVPNKVFKNYLDNFGFGKSYHLETDQESFGDISSLNKAGQIHKATASFGQGITVTPLQMVSAVNVLANDGKLMQPYLVEEINYPNKRIKKTEPKVLRQVIKSQTASQVTAMMVNVVENGYGKKAGVPGYYIAGKTGTAQVAENGKYGSKTVQSFVGFGPVSNPRFTMITKLTNPQGVGWAESSAAPLFGEIAKFLLNYYQIPPER